MFPFSRKGGSCSWLLRPSPTHTLSVHTRQAALVKVSSLESHRTSPLGVVSSLMCGVYTCVLSNWGAGLSTVSRTRLYVKLMQFDRLTGSGLWVLDGSTCFCERADECLPGAPHSKLTEHQGSCYQSPASLSQWYHSGNRFPPDRILAGPACLLATVGSLVRVMGRQ